MRRDKRTDRAIKVLETDIFAAGRGGSSAGKVKLIRGRGGGWVACLHGWR